MKVAVKLYLLIQIAPHGLEAAIDILKLALEDPRDQLVVDLGHDPPARGVLASNSRAAHKVVSLFQLGQQAPNHFGLVLEVGIHRHGNVAARSLEPLHQRDRFSMIGGVTDDDNVGVRFCQFSRDREGSVRAAVIYQDELERLFQTCHNLFNPVIQLWNTFLFV